MSVQSSSLGSKPSPCRPNGNNDAMDWQRVTKLPSGSKLWVNEARSILELPTPQVRGDCGERNADLDDVGPSMCRWKSISSAIWMGGMQSFDAEGGGNDPGPRACPKVEDDTSTSVEKERVVCVFNFKVPPTYDGLSPEPKALLQRAIQKDHQTTCSSNPGATTTRHESCTVGLMTAATMRSLRTATRSSGGIAVDAVVTAGISNARTASAPANYFGILPEPAEAPPPGTINTIVVINGCALTPAAMVEAYAIAVEAKCASCADWGIACAKDPSRLAQGTGTDCAVLLCPEEVADGAPSVAYAGKHCLLAELIGQAVREATGEAIRSNLEHVYGRSLWRHGWSRRLKVAKALCLGARPCVPARPMDPVPSAPTSVLLLGTAMVLACYGFWRARILPRSSTVLLAAAAWDRCLPEPPLALHPVVLAGTFISRATQEWIPPRVFEMQRPLLGLVAGLVFMIVTVGIFGCGTYGFLSVLRWSEALALSLAATSGNRGETGPLFLLPNAGVLASWTLEVCLVKATFSLQLLCNIALQMAGFLERSQLKDARAQLAWLCSRDPTQLSGEELAGGTLESLSENLSDGTIAPWFWYLTFGPVGALCYRVINTLDSRIGYRGGRYEWFGKASARLDDLVNLVPARLTAFLLCAASLGIEGYSASGGLDAARLDRRQCSSPNAGWPMAAMAGILGVRLEKEDEYCLGRSVAGARSPNPGDIRKGHKVAQLAGGIALLAVMGACCLKETWLSRNDYIIELSDIHD